MDPATTKSSLPERLRRAFEQGLPFPPALEPHLAGALGSALARPGMMVRAELVFSTARAFGMEEERAESLATALEYFHTASLVIDDLPAMDDAEARRGAPSVHRVYGEGTAILASLALINRGYGLVWHASAGSEISRARQARALGYLEKFLGLGGLLDGQSQDIHFCKLPAAARAPQRVAMAKTVALIRLSLVLPAMLGQAGEHTLCLLDRLAVAWGLAYQTLDDLKDVLRGAEETSSELKSRGRDSALNRPNMALVFGTEEAFEHLRRLLALGDRAVAHLGRREPELFFLEAVRQRFALETRELAGEVA